MYDLSRAEWRKSSRSGSGGNCVEVALNVPGVTAVRDSKDPEGPAVVLDRDVWARFVSAIKAGHLAS